MDRPLPLFAFLLFLSPLGCSNLEPVSEDLSVKRRVINLPMTQWSEIARQDIAILMPRHDTIRIAMSDETPAGPIFPERWYEDVKDAFELTAVQDAFEAESWLDDWQIVSIRIAPCSPLGKQAGAHATMYCWPEVRLVWQPIIYDFFIGWTTVPAYADDRAIHALYRTFPDKNEPSARTAIDEVRRYLDAGLQPPSELSSTFTTLRNEAISQLLGSTLQLRGPTISAAELNQLSMRVETQMEAANHVAFTDRLRAFVAAFCPPTSLHALTSFSLPEGRDPAGIDTWVFLAFDADGGELQQTELTIADPVTGDTLFSFGMSETVAAAAADEVVTDAMAADAELEEQLSPRLVQSSADRESVASLVNDPNQTLVPNSGCASCHSLNKFTFDFHNLSYLQEMDMTISDRVVNDVEHDLNWLNQR